jgi:Ca2+-binding RTX toxin-like protein
MGRPLENQAMINLYIYETLQMDNAGPRQFGPTLQISLETPTDIHLQSVNSDTELYIQGSFSYSSSGAITGTITKVDEYNPSIYASPLITVDGSIDAHTFFVDLVYAPTSLAVWQSVLQGGDDIYGGYGGNSHIYGFGSGGDTISINGNGNWLIGYGGNNTIVAQGSRDIIDRGPGFNQLYDSLNQNDGYLTSGGANGFIFSARDIHFNDIIHNFQSVTNISSYYAYNSIYYNKIIHDVVDLIGLPGLHNFHQVMRHEFIYHHDVAIHDNLGDVIVFADQHRKAQLHPYDFHFFA